MRKAMGAIFLIGVLAVVFLVANFVLYVMIGVFAAETQNLFFVKVDVNEGGKELKSLLLSGEDDYYMEIMGSTTAEGGMAAFEEASQDMNEELIFMDKDCMIVHRALNIGNPVASLGTCPAEEAERQIAEIPVPGARREELKVMVGIA